jgi:hypothetical protein
VALLVALVRRHRPLLALALDSLDEAVEHTGLVALFGRDHQAEHVGASRRCGEDRAERCPAEAILGGHRMLLEGD